MAELGKLRGNSCGEWATCENNHLIFFINEPVIVGNIPNYENWVNWQQKEPKRGSYRGTCDKCGSQYLNMSSGLTLLHLHSDGWGT